MESKYLKDLLVAIDNVDKAISTIKEAKIGQSFSLSLEFVNVGKEPALLMKVEDLIPKGFIVANKPGIYRIEESSLNLKGKQIKPLNLVEANVNLQPVKKGNYKIQAKV